MLSETTLAEGREILGRMTPGEWHWTDHISPHLSIYAWSGEGRPTVRVTGQIYKDGQGKSLADMKGIVWLRNHAADLLAAAEKWVEVEAEREDVPVGSQSWVEHNLRLRATMAEEEFARLKAGYTFDYREGV